MYRRLKEKLKKNITRASKCLNEIFVDEKEIFYTLEKLYLRSFRKIVLPMFLNYIFVYFEEKSIFKETRIIK